MTVLTALDKTLSFREEQRMALKAFLTAGLGIKMKRQKEALCCYQLIKLAYIEYRSKKICSFTFQMFSVYTFPDGYIK